jgi:hypothetical protein
MSVFVVVKYFNYRKEISIKVMGYSSTLEGAKSKAQELARKDAEEENEWSQMQRVEDLRRGLEPCAYEESYITEGVPSQEIAWVEKSLAVYYAGEGYSSDVYAVVKADEFV